MMNDVFIHFHLYFTAMTSFYLTPSLKNINSHDKKTPASRSFIVQ